MPNMTSQFFTFLALVFMLCSQSPLAHAFSDVMSHPAELSPQTSEEQPYSWHWKNLDAGISYHLQKGRAYEYVYNEEMTISELKWDIPLSGMLDWHARYRINDASHVALQYSTLAFAQPGQMQDFDWGYPAEFDSDQLLLDPSQAKEWGLMVYSKSQSRMDKANFLDVHYQHRAFQLNNHRFDWLVGLRGQSWQWRSLDGYQISNPLLNYACELLIPDSYQGNEYTIAYGLRNHTPYLGFSSHHKIARATLSLQGKTGISSQKAIDHHALRGLQFIDFDMKSHYFSWSTKLYVPLTKRWSISQQYGFEGTFHPRAGNTLLEDLNSTPDSNRYYLSNSSGAGFKTHTFSIYAHYRF